MPSPSDPAGSPDALAVSELLQLVGELFTGIGSVRVVGEVAQFTAARSGHWYLTLKDDAGVLSAVMFKGDHRYLHWTPQLGEKVLATGALDVYAPRGTFNLVVRHLARAGEGDQLRRLEALRKRLAAEGLFDPARKRPLPRVPRCIGVATSATGAALQDILRVTGQRLPGVPVLIAHCQVQGDAAPLSVSRALRALAEDGRADVVIVGRGGGSAEDLAAFNDEAVVRAIAAMPVPVISAVGHEVDVSLADLVADLRAATPSHAAELVVPDSAALRRELHAQGDRLRAGLRRRLDRARLRVDAQVLRPPRVLLLQARQRVERAGDRAHRALISRVQRDRARLSSLQAALSGRDPAAVLQRGYAIVRIPGGPTLRDPALAPPGTVLELQLAAGALRARVEPGPR
jgi:exodeoxyribonuclease VII large subunit